MKNLAIILISCGITWFIAKDTNEQKIVEEIQKEVHHEDSVLAKMDSTHSKLSQAMYKGDEKVVSTIEKAANTITTLKEEVVTLENKVKVLTNENKTLKAIVSSFSSDSGSAKFNLLPISKGN